jgi:hypothetical protein
MEKQKPGEHWREKPSHDATVTPALSDLAISKSQSSRWQQLAAVPEAQFEAALAAPAKPTTTGILAEAGIDKKLSARAQKLAAVPLYSLQHDACIRAIV